MHLIETFLNMKKNFILILSALVLGMGTSSCGLLSPDQEPDSITEEISKATAFARDAMGVYYLWIDEIGKEIERLEPDTCRHPVEVVSAIRYHEDGKEVDHWTTLTDDMEYFQNSVQGIGVSYGYHLGYGRVGNQEGVYFLLVNYVSNDSPASRAGLKRGDIILTLDGQSITDENLYDAFDKTSITVGVTNLEYSPDGAAYIGQNIRSVSLKAEDMYDDPVLIEKTFEAGGKKIGYLAYTSFDLKSSTKLPEVFRRFKEQGIEELILDLRYNGGGYAFTEGVLGSLIVPEIYVKNRNVFQTEVYNRTLTSYWSESDYDTKTYFSESHDFDDGAGNRFTVDLSGCNPDIKNVYALVTANSASASEGLIVGLMPYVNVKLIGTRTGGKYCAGYMLSPEDLYRPSYDFSAINDWGIYVMISKFADRDGDNPAIPDGIAPELACEDDPFDGYQLGDENETMLKAALMAAGKEYPAVQSVASGGRVNIPTKHISGPSILIKNGPLPSVR